MRRSGRDRAVQVRVSARERATWRTAAAALGLDLSELVRDAVRSRLAQVGPLPAVAEAPAPATAQPD